MLHTAACRMNYEVEPSLHPAGKRIIGRIAFRLDTYKSRQSPAREQHRPRVWFTECLLTAFSAHPDHQRHTGDAAAHIAVDQKRQAAYHLLFDHIAPAGQQLPHPLGSRGIVAQRPVPLFVIAMLVMTRMRHSPCRSTLARRCRLTPIGQALHRLAELSRHRVRSAGIATPAHAEYRTPAPARCGRPVAGCFLEEDLDPATCRELRPTQSRRIGRRSASRL